jgi:putative Mn2+ efflux pump MntP
LVIGGVALTLTVIGTRLGGALGAVSRLGARAGVFAGMVLIGIGLKMLCDHNVFAALP